MLDDDKAASPKQAQQMAAGQAVAISAAVHALIASHPNPATFAKHFAHYDQPLQEILLLAPALQADDGLRQAYSETRRSLLAALPGS